MDEGVNFIFEPKSPVSLDSHCLFGRDPPTGPVGECHWTPLQGQVLPYLFPHTPWCGSHLLQFSN